MWIQIERNSVEKTPMHGMPSKIATVAGTAPFVLTMASTSFAVSKFRG